jgi:hypothetical protein
MKRKDYEELADILGNMYYKADNIGKNNVRRHTYEIVNLLEKVEKNFKGTKFMNDLEKAGFGE